MANPCPALLASSQPQPAEQRQPEKPCSPPNWFQQFPRSPLTPSTCLGLAPRLHPHLHGPQSPPPGVFLSPSPLCPSLCNCAVEHIVSGSPRTSPWLSGSILSLLSKKEGNCCRAEPDSRPRLLRDGAAGKGDAWCLRHGGEKLNPTTGSGFGGALCAPTTCPLCCLQATILSAVTCCEHRAVSGTQDSPGGVKMLEMFPHFPGKSQAGCCSAPSVAFAALLEKGEERKGVPRVGPS